MSVPYETAPFVVEVGGGQVKTVQVNFPSRSLITKVIVKQIDGALGAFELDLYNHADALEGNEASQSADSGERFPLDVYRVSPDGATVFTADANGYLEYFSEFSSGGHGLMFFCQDESPANRSKKNQPNLYVRISPSGSGDKKFVVVIGGEQCISGA